MSDEKPCVSPNDTRHTESTDMNTSHLPVLRGNLGPGRAEWQREQDIASVRAGHCPGRCKDAYVCRELGCQWLSTEYGI
jgi:hypothetical protein